MKSNIKTIIVNNIIFIDEFNLSIYTSNFWFIMEDELNIYVNPLFDFGSRSLRLRAHSTMIPRIVLSLSRKTTGKYIIA